MVDIDHNKSAISYQQTIKPNLLADQSLEQNLRMTAPGGKTGKRYDDCNFSRAMRLRKVAFYKRPGP